MSISLGAEGGADVRLILGGQVTAHDPLLKTGRAVATALFPKLESSVGIDKNGGGYPFVHVHAAGVYLRGPHPVVTIDTEAALTALASMGYRDVDVDISAPYVPTTAHWKVVPDSVYRGHWYWLEAGQGKVAPSGTIELEPHPRRGVAAIALALATLASLVLAILGLRRRRRLPGAAGAMVAFAAVAIDIVTAGAVQPDNLGVAGLVNGLQLNILKWLPLPCALAAISTLCLFAVTIARTGPPAAVPQFNPPPGWPPAPPGWTPVPGWHPDPSWPPAPPGWAFYPASNPYEPPPRKRARWFSSSSP